MRNETIGATIVELVRQFPETFASDPAQVRPLKLGILRDIYAQSVLSHRRISAALRSYCHSVQYLHASVEGAARLDLAGDPVGAVTAKEAESAQRRLVAKWKVSTKAASTTVGTSATVASPRAPSPSGAGAERPARANLAVVVPKPGRHRFGLADAAVASPRAPSPSGAGAERPARTNLAVVAPKPGHHRLGLADLKKAAMARKVPVAENTALSDAFT